MNDFPTVYVSIVTYKSADFIKKCLDSLSNQTYPTNQYKIIISDNNTSDGTLKICKNPKYANLEIIENKKNLGFSGGHNKVFQKAIQTGAIYVAVVNYDTVFREDWLENLVKAAEDNPQAGSVQSLIMLWNNKKCINSCGNKLHYLGFGFTDCYQQSIKKTTCKNYQEITYASGCSVLFRTSVLKKTSGFNEEMFAYHEDSDLGWRIRLTGFKNILAKKSVMYHKYEFARSIQNYYFMERNRFLLILLNYKIKTILLLLPVFCVMEFGLWVFAFKNGWAWQKIRAVAYFLHPKVWVYIMSKRRFIHQIRLVNDKEIIKMFCGQIVFQDVDNWLLKNIGNPLLYVYWRFVKALIIW